MSRERLEVWVSYFLEAARFMEKHVPSPYRWVLHHLPRFFAFGECFVTYREGKLAGVGIAGLTTMDEIERLQETEAIVKRWGAGNVVFCALSLVRPGLRGREGKRILAELLQAATRRFPYAHALAFERMHGAHRFHIWKLSNRPSSPPSNEASSASRQEDEDDVEYPDDEVT